MDATEQIDKLIASRSESRRQANEEAARQRAEDLRRLQAMRAEHKVLWIAHYRKLAFVSLQDARGYRARARRLETGG